VSRNGLLVAVVGLVGLVAGCSVGSSPHQAGTTGTFVTPTTVSAAPPAQPLTLTVYDAHLVAHTVRVARTRAVAAAALRAIGVDARVSIANGTATVALDHASDGTIRQIVLTLTQFSTVKRVDVAGQAGITRTDALPAILVESPTAGSTMPRTFTVRGTASVYEGTLVVELRRGSTVLERRTVTASAGAPARGTFAAALHATSAGGAIVAVYAPSAAYGSPQHEQDVEVTVGS
jgi:hypothetical protein